VINLRYHIISITAVFLALGIGLTLGSTFLDRVTVDHLESQLTNVEHQVQATRSENDQLKDLVGEYQKTDSDLSAQLPEQLLSGHLTAVPVLVIATAGTDQTMITRTLTALGSAGAQVAGTWSLTDRWNLDKDADVQALSALLALKSTDVDRLRRNSAIRIADRLQQSAAPAATAGIAPVEPPLIAALVKAGFVNEVPLEGAADRRVLLPSAAVRYVVVSGAAPKDGSQALVAAMLDELSTFSNVSVAAAQGLVHLPDTPTGPASVNSERTTFVGPIRQDAATRAKITTIDDLDTPAGLAALVLGVQELGAARVGHYGVASGATRLLPAPIGS
jgi:hypothetical protein